MAWVLLLGCFGLFGLLIGAQGVLWAEVVADLDLSAGTFGTVLLLSPLLSVGLLLAGGSLSAWAGLKRLLLLSLGLQAGSCLAIGEAQGIKLFLAGLLLGGVANGLLEIAANGATLDWERATGRAAMNVMHAGFSGGAVVGALGAGWLLERGGSRGSIFALLAGICGATALAAVRIALPRVDRAHAGPAGLTGAVQLLVVQPSLAVLALLAIQGVVGESVANTWAVIYLRGLGAPPVVGGATFAVFNGAMLVGRLANAPVVARFGARRSLQLSGIGLAGAGGLLLLPESVPQAALAFVLLGLGVAGVVPTVLSAAATLAPGRSGAVAGGILAAAYLGFVLCPPFVGWLAEVTSLRVALLTVGASGATVLWLARRVPGAVA